MQEKRIKLTGIQRIIAQKMLKSKQTIPHITTIREVRMDQIIKLRENIKNKLKDERVSYIAFILKAVTEALKEYPIINSSLDNLNNEIIIKRDINIGLAIAVKDKLLVPVIKNIGQMEFIDLIRKINNLIKISREGKLNPEDFKGGTFTVSNSGAFGGEIFTPIINYPESAILGIGKIQKKPVVNENNEIVIGHMMYLCLSYDHRIINGSVAVQFLGKIEENLNHLEEILQV